MCIVWTKVVLVLVVIDGMGVIEDDKIDVRVVMVVDDIGTEFFFLSEWKKKEYMSTFFVKLYHSNKKTIPF